MNLLITYFILGISLAAPIGPVNSARIDKGIKNGFWHAWIVGAGGMAADGILMLLVYAGLIQFLTVPIVQTFLWLFGAFVLIYTGVEGMFHAERAALEFRSSKDSLWKCLFTGFILSISSPLSILFWIGIYGSILAKTAVTNGTEQLFLYTSMIFLGLAAWDLFVASVTTGFRRFVNEKSMKMISMVSGFSLICFGLYFGWQGIGSLAAGWMGHT